LLTCRIDNGPFVEEVEEGRTPGGPPRNGADMSTTAQVPTRVTAEAPIPAAPRQPVWKHGVAAAVVASVATTVLAALASDAGVSFADGTGASIPIAGFTQLTLVFSLVGVGIAAVMARKARRPRRAFVRTAVALTALSFVPDLAFGFDAGSAATLITLHTVAAAIVVPTLAGRLARTRWSPATTTS
jgi:amino acid transporter